MKLLARLVRGLFGAALALLLLFEEWGWEPLQRSLARLGRLPLFAWIERRIAALPPYAALALFGVPTLALLPIKLAALWLVGHGQAALGLAVIIAAKVLGTAVVARLFVLTQSALLRLAWFAALYGWWAPWKNALLDRVRASWAWRAGRVVKRRVRERWRRWRQGLV